MIAVDKINSGIENFKNTRIACASTLGDIIKEKYPRQNDGDAN